MKKLFNGIVSMQKNSFIDFPRTASAVLFFNGCNLRCPYCHNSALALGTEKPSHSIDDIIRFLDKRKTMLDGVVITGGEPTLFSNLPNLISYLKDEFQYKIKLDSNGLNPKMLKGLDIDYLALDVKTSPRLYGSILGAKVDVLEPLKESIEIVKSMGENSEIRITASPGIVNKEIIEEISELVKGVSRVFIQPFNRNHEVLDRSFYNNRVNFEPEELQEFSKIIAENVGQYIVRGA